MNAAGYLELMSFGPNGWGPAMLLGAAMTLAVASCGFLLGAVIGTFGAWAKIAGGRLTRNGADLYTTVLRGIPDLLVIYLFYFGGSSLLSSVGRLFGETGFISLALPPERWPSASSRERIIPRYFVAPSGPSTAASSKRHERSAWAARCAFGASSLRWSCAMPSRGSAMFGSSC
jgi:His/Glu/Gln/Arg/opine family amino acid ABC transporter permease subunit